MRAAIATISKRIQVGNAPGAAASTMFATKRTVAMITTATLPATSPDGHPRPHPEEHGEKRHDHRMHPGAGRRLFGSNSRQKPEHRQGDDGDGEVQPDQSRYQSCLVIAGVAGGAVPVLHFSIDHVVNTIDLVVNSGPPERGRQFA